MENDAIIVKNVSKSFHPGLGSSTVKTLLIDLFKKHPSKKRQRIPVLHGIDLCVGKGEFIGIVGRNGSGKSTLLKILAGVYRPEGGSIEVHGTLTPFIELGVGFNPELSGRDNVYLNGALLGFSRQDMDGMYKDIVAFAELEDSMDEKLKNYSSGMQVRLAFSIAVKVNSDVLLIDEVLAVGDAKFQKKCYDIFKSFKDSGKTVVFVSHAMPQVEEFCDRVVVIDKGRVLFDGNTKKAVKIYERLNAPRKTDVKPVIDASPTSYRSGNNKAQIVEASLDKTKIKVGDPLKLRLKLAITPSVKELHLGMSIYRADRVQSIFGIASQLKTSAKQATVTIEQVNLTPGKYLMSVGLTKKPDMWKDHFDLMEKQIELEIVPRNNKELYNLSPAHLNYEVDES